MRLVNFLERSMGRPSKLDDAKWEELKRRLAKGEKAADLAREYKVSKAAISSRMSKRIETIKVVANQIVSAEKALSSLTIAEQVLTISLADDLRAISMHLAGAAKYGAATAHRLSGVAHQKVQEIDDSAPLTGESMESLKVIAALTRTANESSQIGISLLSANKEVAAAAAESAKPKPLSGLTHFYAARLATNT